MKPFWQKFANSTIEESYFLWTFLLLSPRIHKFKVLVANLKNAAVFSGKVDISQVLLYPLTVSEVFFK